MTVQTAAGGTGVPEGADRPARRAPRYGEYATPEEVAALIGTRPTEPATPTPAPPRPVPPTRASTGPAAPTRRVDRLVTIALLAFGILNLAQFAAPLLDFEGFLEASTRGTAAESIDFGEAARVGGVVLLGAVLLLVAASTAMSVALLRRGRIAFWVPLVAGVLTVAGWVVVLTVVVLQTPGALRLPGA